MIHCDVTGCSDPQTHTTYRHDRAHQNAEFFGARKHNCRTDGCDLGHDTPPLAGPQKPPRCRLDVEYGGWGRD